MEKNCPVDPNLQLQQQQFNKYKPKKEGDERKHNRIDTTAKQSHQRMSWTKELHQRFVDIIESLGPKRSTPKNILELMNVPGLTRKQISDHLHKHRSSSKSNSSKVPREAPSATSSSNGVPSMENEELHMSTSSQSSLRNKVSNENAALGSQGGFFQDPGPKSENFNNVTVEINLGQSHEDPYKYWEGIPDVFEGFDDVNDPSNFQYIEDSFGTVCDWMRDHICQVRPRPSEFDDFDFDELFPSEDYNNSKGADQS